MREVTLLSYAKVNLTLDVSHLRPDGYHDIDSIAQVIDISDELTVRKADEGVIEVVVDSDAAPAGRENIVYKACEAFLRDRGIRGGARFSLRKRIPVQAGLGGGSGNAAAAIAGLNMVYECGLSASEVAAIAAQVGSDTALFVFGGTTRMRGRGDRIVQLPDAPTMHLVVVKPDAGVPTKWAYSELDKREDRPIGSASDCAEQAIHGDDVAGLVACMANDFDPVVSELVPEIESAKQRLIEIGAGAVLLAGSGAAVFGVFGGEQAARSAAAALSTDFAQVFACRTLTREESALV